MDSIILAYMAGVLDGDGSFGIAKKTQNANPTYSCVVQLANRSAKVIELFRDMFGGSVLRDKPKMTRSGEIGRSSYRWVITKLSDVEKLLELLIPFLKIKSDRAKYLLSYVRRFPNPKSLRIGAEVLAEKEKAYVDMRRYNDWTSFNNAISAKLARKNTDDAHFYSYVAGIMDTDGSFSVKKQVKNKGSGLKCARYLPVISMSFTDVRAINYIRENCHFGKLYVPKNNSCSNGFHYQFGIYKKSDAASFIKLILPYLISKRENAKVLLYFCENSQRTGYCKAGVDPKELAFRDSCYTKLIQLNKYGVYKSSLMDLEPLTGDAEGDRGQAKSDLVQPERSKREDTVKGDAVL